MATTTPSTPTSSLSPAAQRLAAGGRIVFLDYLRAIACFMVMLVHSVEPFYLGGEGTLIASRTALAYCTAIDSALRASVPLFVMASAYLLFPVAGDTATFYRKRFFRVGIPFIVWLLLYAVLPLPGTDLSTFHIGRNLAHTALNFSDSAGHLWFVFMLLGVYIAMPMFSSWVDGLTRKGERWLLGAWLFTTLIPFFRRLAEGLYGLEMVWGEAFWNEFGTFYYISGLIGYVFLGHYFRKWVPGLSWKRTLLWAVPLWAVGYAITAGGFWAYCPDGGFPVEGPISIAVRMETTWGFTTFGVALTTIAYFLIIRKFTRDGAFYRRIVLPISKASYGMYLMHIFILCAMNMLFAGLTASMPPAAGIPLCMVATALGTYLLSAVASRLLSLLPFGRYIVG